jgi:hypothetical protein
MKSSFPSPGGRTGGWPGAASLRLDGQDYATINPGAAIAGDAAISRS